MNLVGKCVNLFNRHLNQQCSLAAASSPVLFMMPSRVGQVLDIPQIDEDNAAFRVVRNGSQDELEEQ